MADSIIGEADEEGICAYQDDFLVGSHSFEDTCSKLDKILKIFIKHNLTLNPKKCVFHRNEIQYLGFQISHHTVSPIKSNITKIKSFPIPKNQKHVKKFLGVCGYYRHLIPAYAELVEPLIKLTPLKARFVWQPIHQQAFVKLQDVFFKSPFLIQPNFNEDFYINTDASQFAISAILMQRRGNDFLPISYFSKTLKEAERRYENLKRELMAIVKGVQAFKYYLYGRHFYILSDCKALEHFKQVSSPADIITRWLMTLGEYKFTFIHLPGKDNVLADYLSRTPFPDTEDLNKNQDLLTSDEVLPVDITEEQIHSNQINPDNSSFPPPPKSLTDEEVKKYLDNLLADCENKPEDPENEISINTILKEQIKDEKIVAYYIAILQEKDIPALKFLSICKDTNIMLYKKKPEDPKCSTKIALPNSLRPKAIRIAHISHYGVQKTYQAIHKKYYWKDMFKDVENVVLSCHTCMISKPHRIPPAPFQSNPIPVHPGDFISIDLVGPFPNGKQILTVIDRFSRHMQLYPLTNIRSQNIIKALVKYFTDHGRPSTIHTDLGKQFIAEIFQEINSKFGIRITSSSTAHPQTNAISERINQSIKSTILALQEDGHNFENAIQIHQMLYNNATHSTTKFSPNYIHFGRELSSLYDVNLPSPPPMISQENRLYFQIIQDLDRIYNKVYGNLLLAQKLQNSRQHKNAKQRNIKVGDIAYIKSSHTFKPRYSGPFTVVEIAGPVNVLLQRPNSPSAKKFKIHIDRIWISPPRRQTLVEGVHPATSSTGAENFNLPQIIIQNPQQPSCPSPDANMPDIQNQSFERPSAVPDSPSSVLTDSQMPVLSPAVVPGSPYSTLSSGPPVPPSPEGPFDDNIISPNSPESIDVIPGSFSDPINPELSIPDSPGSVQFDHSPQHVPMNSQNNSPVQGLFSHNQNSSYINMKNTNEHISISGEQRYPFRQRSHPGKYK